jgi:hypothetical protein
LGHSIAAASAGTALAARWNIGAISDGVLMGSVKVFLLMAALTALFVVVGGSLGGRMTAA